MEERTMTPFPRPLLGFAAWSGTGQTTLLERLIPRLGGEGLRIAAIKMSHHDIELDRPGKDSYRLRRAGADQMVLTSPWRSVTIREHRPPREPTLEGALSEIDVDGCDLVLVEGYRHHPFPKIELHREALGRPWLFPEDPSIIALACDRPPDDPRGRPVMALDDLEAITRFIVDLVRCGV